MPRLVFILSLILLNVLSVDAQSVIARKRAKDAMFHGKITWNTDLEDAKKQAAREGKDLLIYFTASDWNGLCIRLKSEVFDLPAFATAAQSFVFVEVDFPKQNYLPPRVKEQNTRLRDEYLIDTYPLVYLADEKAQPYAKTGYQEGGPEQYVKSLDELRLIKTARDRLMGQADQSTGPARAKRLAEAIQTMDDELVAVHYASIIREIIRLDADDQTRVRQRYGLLIDLQVLLGQLRTDRASADQARSAVDRFLLDHVAADSDQRQRALFAVSGFCRTAQDNAVLLQVCREIVSINASSDIAKMADRIRRRLSESPSNGK